MVLAAAAAASPCNVPASPHPHPHHMPAVCAAAHLVDGHPLVLNTGLSLASHAQLFALHGMTPQTCCSQPRPTRRPARSSHWCSRGSVYCALGGWRACGGAAGGKRSTWTVERSPRRRAPRSAHAPRRHTRLHMRTHRDAASPPRHAWISQRTISIARGWTPADGGKVHPRSGTGATLAANPAGGSSADVITRR